MPGTDKLTVWGAAHKGEVKAVSMSNATSFFMANAF